MPNIEPQIPFEVEVDTPESRAEYVRRAHEVLFDNPLNRPEPQLMAVAV